MTRKQKTKKRSANPTAADMPQNPEFQEFFENLGKIMSVPKSEVDRLLAQEREARANSSTLTDEEREAATDESGYEPTE